MNEETISNDSVLRCLEGATDLHVHSFPDIIDRSGSDLDFARQAKENKMNGFVIKSHYVPTTDRAILTNSCIAGVNVYGSIALNNTVGGINPIAVEVAGRLGGKVVWFPTVDSENEAGKKKLPDMQHPPPWAKMQRQLEKEGFTMNPVTLFKRNGDFTDEVHSVLQVIKKYKMTLATGHISPNETKKLVKFAYEEGLEKIVITHPEFPSTSFSIQEQVDLCKYGVYFERCYSMPATSKTTWEYMFKEVLATKVEHNIISTDLGQKSSIFPVEGMKECARAFLKNGFAEIEVRVMMVDNPKFLVG
ncbi:MAG: DUF6282 family protein [Thermoplasmatales archaeon]